MRRIITFPRSGHHLIESLIEEIFQLHNYDYSYCEYYNCCKSVPCTSNKLLQGNHDFKLDIDQIDIQTIVLYRRDAVLQLDAWFRYRQGKKYGKYNHLLKTDPNWWHQNSYERKIQQFMKNFFSYYSKFVNKWVNSLSTTILPIDYYDFVNDSEEYLKKILDHLFIDIEFDEKIISSLELDYIQVQNQMPSDLHKRLSEFCNSNFNHQILDTNG